MWWHNYVFPAVVGLHCYLEVRLSRRSLLMSVGDKNSLALQVLVVFMWRETCCPHTAVPFEETVNREWCDASCEKCIQYISTARPYMNRSSSRIYEKKGSVLTLGGEDVFLLYIQFLQEHLTGCYAVCTTPLTPLKDNTSKLTAAALSTRRTITLLLFILCLHLKKPMTVKQNRIKMIVRGCVELI